MLEKNPKTQKPNITFPVHQLHKYLQRTHIAADPLSPNAKKEQKQVAQENKKKERKKLEANFIFQTRTPSFGIYFSMEKIIEHETKLAFRKNHLFLFQRSR